MGGRDALPGPAAYADATDGLAELRGRIVTDFDRLVEMGEQVRFLADELAKVTRLAAQANEPLAIQPGRASPLGDKETLPVVGTLHERAQQRATTVHDGLAAAANCLGELADSLRRVGGAHADREHRRSALLADLRRIDPPEMPR
jgi:hypothetical protein